MVMVEIWWLSLVINTTNNGSEWQVWEMHTAIIMSIGERILESGYWRELPPVAQMLHCGNVTEKPKPKPVYFKAQHVSQIHHIRTNTMLQHCF